VTILDLEPTQLAFPRRSRGRPSAKDNERYELAVLRFCEAIQEIASTLDFKVSARGWCYVLEPHGLLKGDFDSAERLINDCRKNGNLPLDICAKDESRSFENLEDIDHDDPGTFAQGWVDYLASAHETYTPISFWKNQKFYVQMMVEKIDLKSLFSPVCAKFCIPIANMKGWSDINGRAEMMARFQYWEERGKECVLLVCCDHDPGGLNISNFLRSNLSDLTAAVDDWSPENLIIERFGLNFDFIEEHNLTWIDNLVTSSGERLDDPDHPDHHKSYVQSYLREYGARKVEANALVVRPEAGRALCRQAILKYVNRAAAGRHKRALAAARTQVRDLISSMR
jgi:hypothetical protein